MNGAVGKILYFWIFILGGMMVAALFDYPLNDPVRAIVLVVVLAITFIGWHWARAMGIKQREAKKAANRTPVRKGTPHQASAGNNRHKKKKRR